MLIWLENLEYELRCAVLRRDYLCMMYSLDAYAAQAMPWLDDIAQRRAEDVARVRACWETPGVAWKSLGQDALGGLVRICAVDRRLAGLPV